MNAFQKELNRGGNFENSSHQKKEPSNRFIVILRGFLSYWLQKKHSILGVKENKPDQILQDFLDAYDLQMDLVTPNKRHFWLQEQI